MTLDDLFSRVIRAHFVMILAIALVPVAIVLGVGATQARDWRATVRIQTTAAVPTSSTEAEALSSRVLAIATTPSVVGEALSTAGLKGDQVEISEKHVSAQRLGESPIVELTVTDPDGPEAKAFVRALSVQVLKFMNNADRGRFETAVEDVNRRLADSRDQRDRLAKQIEKTPPGDARDRLEQLATEAAKVTSELAAQRASLEMADITRGEAVLVDGSTPTVVRVPSSLLPRAGLALVLGLCLGIACAAAVETLRPKVPDARGLARLLDTPVLTTTKQPPADLARTLSLVARRNGLDTVVIVPADTAAPTQQAAASALARGLERLTPDWELRMDPARPVGSPRSSRGVGGGSGGPHALDETAEQVDRPWTTSFADLSSLQAQQEVSAGIAVVCSGPVPHAQIEALHDVLRATHWPLIGVLDAGRAWAADRPDVWTAGGERS